MSTPLPLFSTSCAACGAPIYRVNSPVVVCTFCGTAYVTPKNQPAPPLSFGQQFSQVPDIGNLILGTDFRDPAMPGWVRYRDNESEFRKTEDGKSSLWVSLKKEDSYIAILSTPGPLDAFDTSVNIQFLKGDMDGARAGIEFSWGDEGNYLVAISPQGTFCVGYHIKRTWGEYLSNWGEHPALKKGWGMENRLRVVHREDQIRVFLNGDLATSLRDSRYSQGRVMVAAGPIKADSAFTISDLQIREAE